MSTGTRCTVTIAGTRLPDGSPGDDPLAPNALSGLTVGWGRTATVEQPAPSTCTFDVLDIPGGPSFLSILSPGKPVTVTATGDLFPDPSVSTFVDPGFDTGQGGRVGLNAGTAILTDATSNASLRVVPGDGTARAGVQLAPDAFAAPGDNPTAWDAIPTTAAGQRWSYGARIYAPTGAIITVRPTLYTGPWAAAVSVVNVPLTFAGDNTWHTIEGDFEPATSGAWVGIEVSAYPTGDRWVDVAPATRWADVPAQMSWLSRYSFQVDDVEVLAPAAGTTRSVLVFAGRITDVTAAWDDSADAPVVKVTAADFTADLDNRDVGDVPWTVESMGNRFRRVLTLAGLPITSDIAPTLDPIPVSWVDVDAQPATTLLRELATSVDGVMWSAVHATTGAYLVVEDAGQRAPLLRLQEDPTGLVVIVMTGGRVLSACSVLRDPVTFQQTVADVATRTAVQWKEQGVGTDGQPTTTDRTVIVVDPALEATLGTRRLSVSTVLMDEDDARDVANRLLARVTSLDWRAAGFVLDDDHTTDTDLVLDCLDGTTRIGMPLQVVDMPPWAPTPSALSVYVEGGSLHFDDGRWVVDMTVSRAAGQGVSVTWAELDATWRWVDMDPGIAWLDVIGVAGPT